MRQSTADARGHGRIPAEPPIGGVADNHAVLEERLVDRARQYRRVVEDYSAILRAMDETSAERAIRSELPAPARARENEARAALPVDAAAPVAIAPTSRSLGL